MLKIYKNKIENLISTFKNARYTKEYTSDNSIFYTVVLTPDLEIHIDLFISEIGKDKELFYSIYQDKNCMLFKWSTLNEMIDKLGSWIVV